MGNTMNLGMMIGMGLIWLLIVSFLIMTITALWTYLRSGKERDE